MTFDPDGPAPPGSGVFGLPTEREGARVVLIPAPFDATTSYGAGCADGPGAILEASRQVDLFDHLFGRVYEGGLFMEDPDPRITELSASARALAAQIIERGGAGPGDERAVRAVDDACDEVERIVRGRALAALDEGRVPGVVGGDHSTPLGALRAVGERLGEFGVLQLDAHADLREAYEGFRSSHASIMFNALAGVPQITKLVQVGLRDYAESERALAEASGGRVAQHFDADWWAAADAGAPFASLCEAAIEPLPELVYVSFDIDALDPSLCPNTGTPVPGGPSFNQASALLAALARSGRRIVGFDLVEVAPAKDGADEWDANVGARVLYRLAGAAMASAAGS